MRSHQIFIGFGLIALLVFPGWFLFYQSDPFTWFQLELNTSGSVYVQWKITTTNARFEVQRSHDQKQWTSIHFTSPQLESQYQFLDVSPSKGINYYRIKLVSEKRDTFFSSTKKIELMDATDCYLWPQPATNSLHVEVPFSYGTLEIIDASGRTSVKQSLSGFRSEIRITQLPKGIYFARIKYQDKIWLRRFVKQ